MSCAPQQRVDQSRLSDFARYGRSIAISDRTAVVGAYQEDGSQGAVYVLTRVGDGHAWSHSARIASPSPADEQFGDDVAIDGSTIVVGAPLDHQPGAVRAGRVYVLTPSDGAWASVAQLASPGTHQAWEAFGGAVAIDGDTIVVGAVDRDAGAVVDAGAAFVFTRSGGTWSFTQTLTAPSPVASDKMGSAVAIAGDTIAVSALRRNVGRAIDAGAVFVYQRSGSSWSLVQTLTATDAGPSDLFGTSVALEVDAETGDRRLVVGAESDDAPGFANAGAAYVFEAPAGGSFAQTAKLVASDPAANAIFGTDVALSGDRIVVGASGASKSAGAAYVFAASAGSWAQVVRLDRSPSDASAFLGTSVAIAGMHALIGATGEEVGATTGTDSGAVHAFREHEGGTWAHGHALHAAHNPSATTYYGSAIAIAGATVVAASPVRADAFQIDADGLSLALPLPPPASSQLWGVGTDGASIAVFARRQIDVDEIVGTVQVFGASASGWTLEAAIEPDLTSPAGPFEAANSGCVSIDGETLAIGAPRWNGGDGRAFVWTRTGGVWSQLQAPLGSAEELTNFDMNFGRVVQLDGDTLMIAEVPSSGLGGSTRNGKVHVYVRDGEGPYVLEQTLTEATPAVLDGFGSSAAISGDLLAVLTRTTKTVRVYRRTAGVWSEIWSVVIDASISSSSRQMIDIDGDLLAIGVPGMQVASIAGAGEVRVYRRAEDDTYAVENVLRAFDPVVNRGFGAVVQIDGDRVIAATADGDGGVYSFPL
ncbi:FG-GAP repeat protein [Sandaracinus amylolyticus]|uniref:Hemagglutinin protein n=1 Tax=Sandaracinus amylolyticus TaxID=927083 RepID=A0A0F6W8S8_9BACT|nr:FG-GAP repeat protein [Sandaracinus amylolyticus]AKF10305.1 hemagglutinin protein [Sandaracinus amylolyticus]